ncbi:MAG: hypothetical protein NC483_07215, partial [Ruminococcus sp.]|nr:hypothetical protein [Ruminococcus sp.]
INIDLLSKIPYNEIIEKEEDSLERLLYIFICEDKHNLDELYLNNKIMEVVRNKMVDLSKDFMDGLYYDYEAFKDREAYELGTNAGRKERDIEIAKNLLIKNKLSYEDIRDATGLSLKDIEDLSKNLKSE